MRTGDAAQLEFGGSRSRTHLPRKYEPNRPTPVAHLTSLSLLLLRVHACNGCVRLRVSAMPYFAAAPAHFFLGKQAKSHAALLACCCVAFVHCAHVDARRESTALTQPHRPVLSGAVGVAPARRCCRLRHLSAAAIENALSSQK